MLAKRIIPCLDVKDGRTVKGVNFVNLTDVGDPVELGAFYAAEGADELVYLDISASREARHTFTRLVERIADRINIPFTVGGGISTIEDASRLLDAGADKITINSAAVAQPELISEIAARYGSQFVVVAIDARFTPDDGIWHVTTHGGSRMSERELFSWARESQERGAGEIMFTSMNHDGTRSGYPCEAFSRLSAELSIPIIASGGAGSVKDIAEVLTKGRADAALAASIFHYGEISIGELKRQLAADGIPVRLIDRGIER
ncbi:MAG: imidazole glycerol phosphate synthase subunit HisF [Bacteroidales bacterium]|nr:imidazole glycerol phosphate synthase subunit HisF [Bacteroidales bacterium]